MNLFQHQHDMLTLSIEYNIIGILKNHKLEKVEFDFSIEPLYVLWCGKRDWEDLPVVRIGYRNNQLILYAQREDSGEIIELDRISDIAYRNISWLIGIRKALLQHLELKYRRICNHCGKQVKKRGYVVGGYAHYCSKKCLHKYYPPRDWSQMTEKDQANNCYKEWEDHNLWEE